MDATGGLEAVIARVEAQGLTWSMDGPPYFACICMEPDRWMQGWRSAESPAAALQAALDAYLVMKK